MKPVALVTGIVSDHRVAPFRALHAREEIEVLAWDDPGPADSDLPVRRVGQLEAARLVASGRYRAAVVGIGGRLALPAGYLAARRARVPFVLWASLWAHPRTPVHSLSFVPLRAIYKRADAVVTYGPHVTLYVEQYRRAGNVFEAPQAVDPGVFGRTVPGAPRSASFEAVFVGRLVPEKGLGVLLQAWQAATLPDDALLTIAGTGPVPIPATPGVRAIGFVPRERLPELYAAADVLVLPSLHTATFREPWGLVTNEAMHQGTPVIASNAVGAAAGGLVVDGRTGFVVPAGDAAALAARLSALAANAGLRERLGAAARGQVARHTPEAWAEGVSRALAAVGASRS